MFPFEGSTIIGGSGFIGNNIQRLLSKLDFRFNVLNSKSIETEFRRIDSRTVFIAAPSAVKWWANLHPLEDLEQVERLINNLRFVDAQNVILLSTIDVIRDGMNSDESTLDFQTDQAYGSNRRHLELACFDLFPKLHIVRLPALVGEGLKKNVFFDLMHSNQLEKIDFRGEYQWYVLDRLISDLYLVLKNNLNVVNLVSEPISTFQLVQEVFPDRLEQILSNDFEPGIFQPKYNIKSQFADLWRKNSEGYMYGKDEILEALLKQRHEFKKVINEN
jgi:nucleoside-diphosphate-sugar epimerase